jgi:hypothetical protein
MTKSREFRKRINSIILGLFGGILIGGVLTYTVGYISNMDTKINKHVLTEEELENFKMNCVTYGYSEMKKLSHEDRVKCVVNGYPVEIRKADWGDSYMYTISTAYLSDDPGIFEIISDYNNMISEEDMIIAYGEYLGIDSKTGNPVIMSKCTELYEE